MNPNVAEQLPGLEALCVRHRVARLELIGSAATDQFDAFYGVITSRESHLWPFW
ncbi:MAG: hypothetical protein V3S64_10850 [bacterium]